LFFDIEARCRHCSAMASAENCKEEPPVAVSTIGLGRIRGDLANVLGRPVVYRPPLVATGCGAIAGWGLKPTSRAARAAAALWQRPYIAIEDGFLRSIRPGRREPSSSYVVDRSGIYYDASRPSDLEAAVTTSVQSARTREAMALLRALRLSKYNNAPPLELKRGKRVLVVDQTYADASVAGAGADATTFRRMLDAAIAENPGADVLVKIHPETVGGNKRGYLARELPRGVTVLDKLAETWSLLEASQRVYTVSSLLGFEALIAGCEVICFGVPFYAGWGLTSDRMNTPARRRPASLEALFEAAYLRYATYLDAWTRKLVSFEEAAEQLAFLKRRYFENVPTVCVGVTPWKRKAVTSMLDGAGGPPVFANGNADAVSRAKRNGARVVVWAAKEGGELAQICAKEGVALARMEDGFLRSVGLGAKFVPPASLSVDEVGIYYDPTRPSGFETLVESADFDAKTVARAKQLRETIVHAGLSKYNERQAAMVELPRGRPLVLVPGQVEDDASIRFGTRRVKTNLALLEAARRRNPDARIVYKTHPDVAAGLRQGKIAPQDLARLADVVADDWPMPKLLQAVDRVETMTSLTGFEALMRGKPVVTHGQPFYAGWSLTEDLDPVERRRRRLSLDELVAATLILYPRYIDPAGLRPCEPELVVARFREMLTRAPSWSDPLRRRARNIFASFVHNMILPLVRRG
jgi:capsular polysaccharide export protein